MQLSSLNLSKKLLALGCKSESGFCWSLTIRESVKNKKLGENWFLMWIPKKMYKGDYISAFSFCDFLGQSELARENRKKIVHVILEKLVMIPIVNGDGSLGKTISPSLSFQTPEQIFNHVLADYPQGPFAYIERELEGRV